MKYTAVQWLEIVLIPDPISEEDFKHNIKCWKQAKKKEKNQMIDFVITWMGEGDLKEDIIKHYNETFNTKD
jgi:5,10-methenyltetrahydromethanopterin hydrogenase